MADKTLISLQFPGLSDAYRVPQIAPEYDEASTYATGDWCTHGGRTYRCRTAIAAAEAWTAAHWAEDWAGEHLETSWEGTQAEYDALASHMDYDNYYILEASS